MPNLYRIPNGQWAYKISIYKYYMNKALGYSMMHDTVTRLSVWYKHEALAIMMQGKDINSSNMHMKNLNEALICIVHTIIYIYSLAPAWNDTKYMYIS